MAEGKFHSIYIKRLRNNYIQAYNLHFATKSLSFNRQLELHN